MKKRFWMRLISAVLTMAMAFSILAVPASADSEWRLGIRDYHECEWIFWMDADSIRDIYEEHGSNEIDGLTDEMLEEKFRTIEKLAPLDVKVISQRFINENEFGLSSSVEEGNTVYVYEKETLEEGGITFGELFDKNAEENGLEIDETTGTLKINTWKWIYDETGMGKKVLERQEEIPLAYKTTIPSADAGPALTPSGNSTISSGDGTAIVLAAVGATAAATGVYLYTHPEKVEAIKDFFADLSANVQSKVQELTSGIKDTIQGSLPGQAGGPAEAEADAAA